MQPLTDSVMSVCLRVRLCTSGTESKVGRDQRKEQKRGGGGQRDGARDGGVGAAVKVGADGVRDIDGVPSGQRRCTRISMCRDE